MTEEDTVNGIIAFAGQMTEPGKTPEETARDRGWLTETREPTEEGRQLVAELAKQRGTRSLYRSVP